MSIETFCKHCNPAYSYGKDYEMNQCGNKAYKPAAQLFMTGDPTIVIFGDGYTAYGYFKVNYCPICGRKLTNQS